MSEDREEFKLGEDMKAGLDEADRWVKTASSELGLAYLEYEDAKLRFEVASGRLNNLGVATRKAEIQRSHVLAKMSAMLNLGPGEWVYDGIDKLVRKDAPDAKSS